MAKIRQSAPLNDAAPRQFESHTNFQIPISVYTNYLRKEKMKMKITLNGNTLTEI